MTVPRTRALEYLRLPARGDLRRREPIMTQESPLVRQWILLRLLSARHHGASVKEMADEAGVSVKTIRRDLEAFQQAGFPLAEVVEDHGRKKWRVGPDRNQPGLSFSLDEVIALYLARYLMEPLAGTVFWEAVQRAFKKIRVALGPQALNYMQRFGEMFHHTAVGASDYSKKSALIDQLMIGIEDRRAVFITYQSLRATEPVTYDIYPYGLAYHRGSLYLVGFAPDHREIRHWKVDRIADAEVTPVHFHRPEGFDLHEHLSKSFGVFHGDGQVHVKIRFAPTVARYVTESHWHGSQRLAPQSDGTLIAEFDLDQTEEIKRWIQSFGRHAVVLEPERLRRELIDELTALCDLYKIPAVEIPAVDAHAARNAVAGRIGAARNRRRDRRVPRSRPK
ncbi:MAG: WYL domain-containing protein [Planctomycetes bacterium]|nr:WYL domain-containing protein [Planctomycetota bacterium]